MTRRRWIAEHWDEATATIIGAQAEHLARVLRAQPGMEADVVAGGRVFHAEIAAVTQAGENSEVRFNLASELQADPALPVTLVVAVYKFDRMEWAIEKATELGVAAVVPVVARRTEKHLAQAAEAAGAEMPVLEIAIGPEGGWAPDEEALFDANGWRAASLGPRIVRAETAAIAALAVVASCLE